MPRLEAYQQTSFLSVWHAAPKGPATCSVHSIPAPVLETGGGCYQGGLNPKPYAVATTNGCVRRRGRRGRPGAVPSAATAPPKAAGPSGGGAAPPKPPRLELEGGRKWVIEHQVG